MDPGLSLSKRREFHHRVRRRKSFVRNAIYDERPEPENRTPGVNWFVCSFRRKKTSSPKGTLIETMRADFRAFRMTQLIDE